MATTAPAKPGLLATAEKWIVASSPLVQILVVVAVLAFVAALGLVAWNFLTAPQRAADAQAKAHGIQIVAGAQQAASTAQTQILDRSAEKQAVGQATRTENARAIAKQAAGPNTLGADVGGDSWRAGLCMYDAAASDPACGRLQQAHPAKPSKAGP